jgi:hypothetical protein
MSNNNGTCTHIKVTGVRCGSPALRGEQFCYFHQNAHRSVRRPKQSRLHPIALIEDEESIQYALMEVINALMRNTIDLKRATLILRALHIAVKNASRVKYGIQGKSAVTKIPEYAPPSAETDFDELSQIDLPYNAFVPPKTERQIMEEKHRAHKLQEWRDQQAQIRANLERARITPSVGPEVSPAPRPETQRRARPRSASQAAQIRITHSQGAKERSSWRKAWVEGRSGSFCRSRNDGVRCEEDVRQAKKLSFDWDANGLGRRSLTSASSASFAANSPFN